MLWSHIFQSHTKNENYISTIRVSMATKQQDVNLPWQATAHKVTWLLDIVLHDNVTNKNHYISTTRVPMATKLRRIIYLDGLLNMKSYDLWSRDLGRSFDQLTPLYLHCHSTYGPQTWYDGYIPWRLLTTKSYKALIMWYCKVTKTNKNHCISTIRVPIATKLGRMMTYLDVLPPIRVYSKPMLHWLSNAAPFCENLYKALFWSKTLRKGIEQGKGWHFWCPFLKKYPFWPILNAALNV